MTVGNGAEPLRMAQYGTKHGHAAGKMQAMLDSPEVEVAGLFEPDRGRRAELERSSGPFGQVRWFDSEEELLSDTSIVAVASEGKNAESLPQTEAIVGAGKHVWYDKPAGEDWAGWQRVMGKAQEQGLLIQMGYMFRYQNGFCQIAEWVHGGLLGDIYCTRAHMSTSVDPSSRGALAVHQGGIFFDLGGHMLDQVVYLMGRPTRTTSFLRTDGAGPACTDNTLGVLEFEQGLAFVDIAAMEPKPMARRFEVYGTKGSAILLDPSSRRMPSDCAWRRMTGDSKPESRSFRCRRRAGSRRTRRNWLPLWRRCGASRRRTVHREHELLVQETLLRLTGRMTFTPLRLRDAVSRS